MTTARPRNEPIVAACMSRPRPSSANRASCASRSAARRSSSARRLTRNPMTLRSRATGSDPTQLQGGQPGRRRPPRRAPPGRRCRSRPRRAARPARGPGRGPRRAPRSGPVRAPRRRGRARDDREVAGLERLERRDARLQDPDPADLPLGAVGGELASPRAVGPSGRARGGGRGGTPCVAQGYALAGRSAGVGVAPPRGRRAAGRTPARRRRSGRSARPAPTRPSGAMRAQTRRRGR